jgi:hypothetical protein
MRAWKREAKCAEHSTFVGKPARSNRFKTSGSTKLNWQVGPARRRSHLPVNLALYEH